MAVTIIADDEIIDAPKTSFVLPIPLRIWIIHVDTYELNAEKKWVKHNDALTFSLENKYKN